MQHRQTLDSHVSLISTNGVCIAITLDIREHRIALSISSCALNNLYLSLDRRGLAPDYALTQSVRTDPVTAHAKEHAETRVLCMVRRKLFNNPQTRARRERIKSPSDAPRRVAARPRSHAGTGCCSPCGCGYACHAPANQAATCTPGRSRTRPRARRSRP